MWESRTGSNGAGSSTDVRTSTLGLWLCQDLCVLDTSSTDKKLAKLHILDHVNSSKKSSFTSERRMQVLAREGSRSFQMANSSHLCLKDQVTATNIQRMAQGTAVEVILFSSQKHSWLRLAGTFEGGEQAKKVSKENRRR